MNVTLESSGNLLIAYLFGEIDHHTAVAVRSQIDSAIQDKLPGHLILDFKNVTFMDSSGIGLVRVAIGWCTAIKARWRSRM